MLRALFGATCPVCRTTARPAARPARLAPTQPLQTTRFYGAQRRRTPSRMVLSDKVDRPPSNRPPPRRSAGPFAAMNRTVANIRERTPAAGTPAKRDAPGTGSSARRSDKSSKKDRHRKALRMQQSLSTITYRQRNQAKQVVDDRGRFADLNLLPSVQQAIESDALKGLVDLKPTPIQRLAIPALLAHQGSGGGALSAAAGSAAAKADAATDAATDADAKRESFLLAAETGSGKTLAYLLPVIDSMKRAEAEDQDIIAFNKRLEEEKARRRDPAYRGPKAFEPHPTTARPRVVVLVPSAELVAQVGAVAKSLSHAVKFKAELLSSSLPARAIQRNLYAPTGVDLVVATPYLLQSIAESDPNVLSRVTHLVIDEADSLFDRSFAPSTTAIIERTAPSVRQLVLCSATIPRRLDNFLADHFPRLRRITTPNLHAVPRRVQMGVIDVTKPPYSDNKDLACADAIWSIGKEAAKLGVHGADADPADPDVLRIMVFVNERERTRALVAYLRDKGIDAEELQRDAAAPRRSDLLALFMSTERLRSSDLDKAAPRDTAHATHVAPHPLPSRRLNNVKVIVATDLASRGIDTVGVRHVILYDVPHTTIDFIHRLGRVGRMNRRGRAVVLLGRRDRRDVVSEVRDSMFTGQALI